MRPSIPSLSYRLDVFVRVVSESQHPAQSVSDGLNFAPTLVRCREVVAVTVGNLLAAPATTRRLEAHHGAVGRFQKQAEVLTAIVSDLQVT